MSSLKENISLLQEPKTGSKDVTVYSQGYDEPFLVGLDHLTSKKEEEGTTTALIRGIAAQFQKLGYAIGGFAGTIQVFLPADRLESYITLMETVFGKGSVRVLTIRPVGSIHINTFLDVPTNLQE